MNNVWYLKNIVLSWGFLIPSFLVIKFCFLYKKKRIILFDRSSFCSNHFVLCCFLNYNFFDACRLPSSVRFLKYQLKINQLPQLALLRFKFVQAISFFLSKIYIYFSLSQFIISGLFVVFDRPLWSGSESCFWYCKLNGSHASYLSLFLFNIYLTLL